MAKTVATLGLMVVQLFVTYFIFTVGWGLEVRSWSALVLGFIATALISGLMAVVAAE